MRVGKKNVQSVGKSSRGQSVSYIVQVMVAMNVINYSGTGSIGRIDSRHCRRNQTQTEKQAALAK